MSMRRFLDMFALASAVALSVISCACAIYTKEHKKNANIILLITFLSYFTDYNIVVFPIAFVCTNNVDTFYILVER